MAYCSLPKQTRPLFSQWLGVLRTHRYVLTLLLALASVGLPFGAMSQSATSDGTSTSETASEPANAAEKSSPATVSTSTADHTKFKGLARTFSSGSEVTTACLACHTEAAHQVQRSIHWTWEYMHPVTGQILGKKTEINSFCGNVASNEARCTSCHAGYGWTDEKIFDFTAEDKVDCLVCHDSTGTYQKWPTKAGHPLYEPLTDAAGKTHQPPDLSKVAQSVGKPGRANCGACHFYGGGGDNVKHGDLSSALVSPTPHVDVHMSRQGANLVCTDCHTADGHEWPGSRYLGTVRDDGAKPKSGFRRTDVASCQSCHTEKPHKPLSIAGMKLNDHTDRIACQTCHIPTFAKGGVATKTWWDWSTAGKLKDGKPYSETDDKGRHTYLSEKGDFHWEEDVVPDYEFWNGLVEYTLLGDKIDPQGIVEVNRIHGDAQDPDSRIYPFKKMLGRQAYDTENKSLVYTNVFGPNTDTAFWTHFDWARSIKAGMQKSDVPYSGKFDFVDTAMYWPTTHMVAPAAKALGCGDCHAKQGRLVALAGIYLPGRDGFTQTDRIGLGLLALALLGVIGHALLRIIGARRRRQ